MGITTAIGIRPTQLVQRPTMVLLVTYDLKAAGYNYNPFYEALKKQGIWWHFLSTTWLIATSKPPQDLYSELGPYLTTHDLILIVPITRPYWGYLPKDAWDWIEKNLPQSPGNALSDKLGI